jgi:chromate reductase, NAD(P)H dehydrogenase (quinone)
MFAAGSTSSVAAAERAAARYGHAVRIVSLCGSLGSMSANRAALDIASAWIRAHGISEPVATVALDEIPPFDPHLADEPPPPVAEMRLLMGGADGVMIAAPEYAGGVAGSTKNALDWLVGSASIHHRPIAVLSAGTSGGVFAIEQLVRTLSWQGALVVATLGISAPRTKTGPDGRFVDPSTIGAIQRWTQALVEATSQRPGDLLEIVAGIVEPYGIDVGRFGDL